jgi:dsDNA-binding SOS-regulon protein
MNKSKTHLVAVRVDDRIHSEIEEILTGTGKDKADFLREVLVKGLYAYKKMIFQSHADRVHSSLDKSYYAYEREMLDDDLHYIATRFDKLEAMIKENKKPIQKQAEEEEKKTLFDSFFKK